MNANPNASPKNRSAPPQVVLAVSQGVTPGLAQDAPVRDFERLSQAMGAVLVGNESSGRIPLLGRIENATALDFGQAMHILRTHPRADAYVSFSERVGIPLAAILALRKRRPAHVLIAHRLDTRAKQLLDSLTRWRLGVDRIITVCSAQLAYARQFVPDASQFVRAGSTDESYYRPSGAAEEGYVLAVGKENRDYETLLAAISLTSLKVKVVCASPWSRKSAPASLAQNDRVEFLPRLSYPALRELYHKARLVVLPLNDVEYAAGLNGLLEAFCAHKPVVVSASKGISDYLVHLRNAFVVPAADASAMATALDAVYADSSLREALSSGAREAVADYANLNAFTSTLQSQIAKTIQEV